MGNIIIAKLYGSFGNRSGTQHIPGVAHLDPGAIFSRGHTGQFFELQDIGIDRHISHRRQIIEVHFLVPLKAKTIANPQEFVNGLNDFLRSYEMGFLFYHYGCGLKNNQALIL
jgi:hypothetical protein